MSEQGIRNPTRWFYAYSEDAEWWRGSYETREEAVNAGGPEPEVWVCEARRLVPSFKGFFDGADIAERIGEDEVWGEDGWEGDPNEYAELEAALDSVLTKWFAGLTDPLSGAQLDFVTGPEKVQ